MCEMAQAFHQTQRKARKDHRCCECRGVIKAGTLYEYMSGVWDHRGADYKTCRWCVVVRNDYIKQLDPYDCAEIGALYEDWAHEDLPLHVLILWTMKGWIDWQDFDEVNHGRKRKTP